MENISDIIIGRYAGAGFGQVLHWVILFFLAIAALYIVVTALARILEHAGEAVKREEPAVKPQAGTGTAKAGDDKMNETAAAIGLAFHLQMLKNSVKHITVHRAYKSSWKESKRAGAMERL